MNRDKVARVVWRGRAFRTGAESASFDSLGRRGRSKQRPNHIDGSRRGGLAKPNRSLFADLPLETCLARPIRCPQIRTKSVFVSRLHGGALGNEQVGGSPGEMVR